MPFTDVLDTKVVQHAFGAVAWTADTDYYVALSTTTPVQAKGSAAPYWNFTEPSGGGYARVTVANNTTNWVAAATQPATGYEVDNGVAITFPAPTASWGTVTYFGLFSAATTGTLVAYGALTTSKAIGAGDTAPSFAIHALTVANS
jgi:hypothetical protein